jgi:hypothetical protein
MSGSAPVRRRVLVGQWEWRGRNMIGGVCEYLQLCYRALDRSSVNLHTPTHTGLLWLFWINDGMWLCLVFSFKVPYTLFFRESTIHQCFHLPTNRQQLPPLSDFCCPFLDKIFDCWKLKFIGGLVILQVRQLLEPNTHDITLESSLIILYIHYLIDKNLIIT